jgi:hypothetical protein
MNPRDERLLRNAQQTKERVERSGGSASAPGCWCPVCAPPGCWCPVCAPELHAEDDGERSEA